MQMMHNDSPVNKNVRGMFGDNRILKWQTLKQTLLVLKTADSEYKRFRGGGRVKRESKKGAK